MTASLLAKTSSRTCAWVRFNMSIDTDPQQQEAASPRVLVARSFLR